MSNRRPGMQGSRQTALALTAMVLAAIAMTAITGCEPTGWDLVLAAPAPPKDVSAAYDSLSGEISVTYTIPELNELQHAADVIVYCRDAPGDEPVFATRGCLGDYDVGAKSGIVFTPPPEITVGGESTVIVMIADEEFQKSEPVEVPIADTP